MKKKMIVLVLAMVMAFSLAVPSFAASTPADDASVQPLSINGVTIKFTGASGTVYDVDTESDVVGYNHITTGKQVKVCQAYTKITGGNPGTIDGIWGNNSESALRTAQSFLYNKGYTFLAIDGVCGVYTWRSFYYYHNQLYTELIPLL